MNFWSSSLERKIHTKYIHYTIIQYRKDTTKEDYAGL